jgi:hypothetical protein
MKVEKNKVVSLTYELIVDGRLADKADESRPLDYIHGTHMLLPKFESEVEGKEPGESFAFTLTPEEGKTTCRKKQALAFVSRINYSVFMYRHLPGQLEATLPCEMIKFV